jgi:muconate/chloromuconate cycloisomerase
VTDPRASDLHIRSIRTSIIDLPTHRPHQFAAHQINHQAYLIVALTTDSGQTGIGEGVSPGGPWWSGESVEGQRQIIDQYFAPALIGLDALDLHGAMVAMDHLAYGNDFAKAAVEMALVDAAARALGVAANVLIGAGRARTVLPVRWALSGSGGADVVQEATDRLAQGHCSLKMKMGAMPPEDDLRRVGLLVDKIGTKIDYLADPNGVWDFRTAAWAIRELEAIGVSTLEQPIRRSDLAGMTALCERATALRVMADESVCRPADAIAAVTARACDSISVKPGKAGGLVRAAQVAAIATAAGVACYGGTALETSVGTAAAAHLFASLPELPLGCELVGPLLLADDIAVEPVRYTEGSLHVPTGPGLGVEVDWDKVSRYTRRTS